MHLLIKNTFTVHTVHIRTPHRQVQCKYTQTDNIPPHTGTQRSMQADS